MLLCRLAIQISKSDSLPAFSAAEKRRGLLLALALSVKKFFSLFFEAPLAAHHHSRHLKENSAAQPLSSDSLNFLTFLFSKELSNFRPGGLCSPSKAGRLLVASHFPVNSFFQHRVFFRQHDCPPLASLDYGAFSLKMPLFSATTREDAQARGVASLIYTSCGSCLERRGVSQPPCRLSSETCAS